MNKEAFMNPYVILSSVNYREVVEANEDLITIFSLQQEDQIL